MSLHICLPLLVVVLLQPALCVYNCSSVYDRTPDNSDLMVDCGPQIITLEVNLCTAQYAGFNTSQLALNGNHNNSECQGTVDTSVDPPVIRYFLPVNNSQGNACRQSLQIVDEQTDPSGVFGHFSSIQSMMITSFIDTPRLNQGMISYATDLYYHFSCRYPLEYLINNTQIVASSVSVATSDNNGSFVEMLSVKVNNDSTHTYPLVVPAKGLMLRTRIYVEVKAANLTGNFHVLMDHCFATPTPYNNSNSEKHTFFIGCVSDPRTNVTVNGVATYAHFNFEAFRFVQHRDQAKSSIYLHCILRLCEPTKCQSLLSACNARRKRSVTPFGEEGDESATVSAGPIYIAAEERPYSAANNNDAAPEQEGGADVTGVVVGVVFGSAAAAALLVLGGWFVLKKFYWTGGLVHAFN